MNTREYLEEAARNFACILGELVSVTDKELAGLIGETEAWGLLKQSREIRYYLENK